MMHTTEPSAIPPIFFVPSHMPSATTPKMTKKG